jgi:hypothetical protein
VSSPYPCARQCQARMVRVSLGACAGRRGLPSREFRASTARLTSGISTDLEGWGGTGGWSIDLDGDRMPAAARGGSGRGRALGFSVVAIRSACRSDARTAMGFSAHLRMGIRAHSVSSERAGRWWSRSAMRPTNGADAASLPKVARPEGRALTADPFDSDGAHRAGAREPRRTSFGHDRRRVDGHQAP